MSAFAFLSFTCQLGQEGERGFLIQPAFTSADHPRGLAYLFGDGVSADTKKHNNIL